MVDGCFSSPCKVSSGVPQGSVLGPTLFLLYINDISEGIQSQIKLFADDCLVYRNVQTSVDQQILQQDLNTLMKWAEKWQMKFNIKSVIISCKSQTIVIKSTVYVYTMDGTPLMTTEQYNYLGVQLHHKLSWEPHIDYICSKANRTLGFLQRNLQHCPTHLQELAYKQFVLPVLEYCSPMWDPHHQKHISKLEMVQHRAARFVLGRPWKRHQRDSITAMLSTYTKMASTI